MESAEFSLFKSDKPDTRFARLYERIETLEINEAKLKAHFDNSVDKMKDELQDQVTIMKNEIKNIEAFKSNFESLGRTYDKLNESIL